jgi:hypothetical protein
VTIKDASTAAVGRGETRTISIANYESGLRREDSIASQATTDTPIGAALLVAKP